LRMNRRYLIAVALLAVLAVVFGLVGTVAPPLSGEAEPSESSSSSSSSSVAHFQNPPTYDSGWVNIAGKCGQYFSLEHDLNTTEVVVDMTGKQSLDPMSGALAWGKTYGGTRDDWALSMVQTSDGGYALAGWTNSQGMGDFWLVKTDSTGTMQWSQTYGGGGSDYAYSVVQTVDGGYALAGYTGSFGAGGYDFWLLKVKPEMNSEHQRHLGGTDVNVGWSKPYGGTSDDRAYSLVQTGDGGYALAGYTFSFGAGANDFWLVKTDPAGTILWSKTYGGTGNDFANSLIQTSDGGFALAGYTNSYGAGGDFWLVKTDSTGAMQWSKTYGGANYESAYSVVQTSDGGFALVGSTGTSPLADFWLVKTDSTGTMQWSQTYGGPYDDIAYSLVQTSDGGYALAGTSGGDFWLVKTDSTGAMQWSKTYGGANSDEAASLVQTGDGGYALAGYTYSFGAGLSDFWLVKTDSAGNQQWNKTYGGPNYEYGRSVVQTSDGGYALAGNTYSFGAGLSDFWLVKTDSTGAMQWSKTYGGDILDVAYSVVQTVDNSYALAGDTNSYGAWDNHDFLLVKADVEMGLAMIGLTNNTITLYRGKTDLYWNYVRVRIWTIKEPTWIYGDINMDGIVDVKDLYILSRNYGKTFSLLSLTGIIGIAGIHTVKKRKQPKQPKQPKHPSYIS